MAYRCSLKQFIDSCPEFVKFTIVDHIFKDIETVLPVRIKNVLVQLTFIIQAKWSAIAYFQSKSFAFSKIPRHTCGMFGGRWL